MSDRAASGEALTHVRAALSRAESTLKERIDA